MQASLKGKYKQRRQTPASITEAYMVINGALSGDYTGAQEFLKGMSEEERNARFREEQRGNVSPKNLIRFGAKPLSRRSKIYL